MSKKKTPDEVTEEVVEQATEELIEEATEKTGIERCIYVGPTIHKSNLIQNNIYNGIPAAAEAIIAETPLLKLLFVPVENYHDAEVSILHQAGVVWEAYKTAFKYK